VVDMTDKKKRKGIFAKAKKKRAVARAVVTKGTGKVRINGSAIETMPQEYLRDLVREPLILAGPIAEEVNIDVTVKGGGFMGQTISARSAIAKSLLEYKKDDKLRKKFLAYDRILLVDDPRRVEPKKQLGPKARKKKQSSKR